jgi:hypothetical protein
MPQIFDTIEELRNVDWDTIVIYTCQNVTDPRHQVEKKDKTIKGVYVNEEFTWV